MTMENLEIDTEKLREEFEKMINQEPDLAYTIKQLMKVNKKLSEQIKKMKSCSTCKHLDDALYCDTLAGGCFERIHWELKDE